MNSKQRGTEASTAASASIARPTRSYDASGRQAEAALRRARIVDAARELFLQQGYGATSIAAIAERAGVSAPTVYAQFESKAGILARVVFVAVAGDHEEAGLARERPDVAVAFGPGLPASDRIRAMARYARLTNERSARLVALAESVAGTDEAVAALTTELRDGSRADAIAAAHAFAPGELRPDLDVEAVADLLWTVGGSLTYNLLVHHVGHTPDEYEGWLVATMSALMLPAFGDGPMSRPR